MSPRPVTIGTPEIKSLLPTPVCYEGIVKTKNPEALVPRGLSSYVNVTFK